MNSKICPTCHAPIPAHAPGGFCPACLLRDAEEPASAGHAAPSLEEISAAFPQLEIVRLIGQGGMGFVYQVRQPCLDRTVALKILSPELGRDPAFAERFAREARALGKLNHPNIVTVFEHGESGGFFYLLMEYVNGVNLRQAMRAGRFTPEQALSLVPGICDALQAAHMQGVWHRDIKPENILLDARGEVKIADFGVARMAGDPHRNFTLTLTGGALGSAAYMAPEQHETPRDVDHRADIYSLGVVIYEMLTGELPLGRFPAPSQKAAVNERIDEIVFRTLEKERELRQQSAEEVKTGVKSAVLQPATVPSARTGRPAAMTLWSLGLMAGSTALFAAAAALTHGGMLGLLSTFALAAFVLGWINAWFALSAMRHSRISKAWRAGVRSALWSPVVLAGPILIWIATDGWGAPLSRQNVANDIVTRKLEAEAVKQLMRWRVALPSDPNRTYVLGPVIDGVLPAPGPGVACMLDFKHAQLHAPGDDLAERLKGGGASYAASNRIRNWSQVTWDWHRSLTEINAVATMPDCSWIQLFCTLPFSMAGKKFDGISAIEIVDSVTGGLERAENQQLLIGSFARREFIRAPGYYGEPFSFIAPAETGATVGVMEVLGQTADRQGVRVRYRMVGWFTAVMEQTVVNRTIVQDRKAHWEITHGGNGVGKPEVIELDGELEADTASGRDYSALTVHVGGNPVFMVVGKGFCSSSSSQSIGRGLSGSADIGELMDYSIDDGDKATLNHRSYDLTRGRVFLVRPDGTLRQIALRPERLVPAEGLKNFVSALPPEATPAAANPTAPGEAMKAILKAAKERNARAYQSGLSKSFKAALKEKGESLDGFGDFGQVTFIGANQLDAANAEVVVEANDSSRRRFTFRMILEDGEWKLNELGSKP